MNKTKTILTVTGGVTGLAVVAMGVLTWMSWTAKTAANEGDDDEGIDGLETVMSKAQTLSGKPIYPCAASLSALESNRTAVVGWSAEAMKLAVRGDRAYAATTPAAFKSFIVSDAKRLSALPGLVNGVLVKPEFAFGPFKEYIAEGKMPAEAQLAELQRKWDDVATVVETLAKSGIAELTDVQFKSQDEQAAQQNSRGKKGKKGAKQEGTGVEPAALTYVFSFATRPVAFVKAINALSVCERFISVDDFSISRGKDVIAEALGGGEKKSESSSGGGRRGRRGRRAAVVVEENKEEGETKNGIITDPLLDDPFAVVMTVTVHDFKSMEENGAPSAGSEQKKGDSK